ncbi:MAG: hypothetical protein PHN84_14075 [Desulfuromonadaceae bacterium]|nr:hypothetical protein [Desulfuromonadaceae bacterium]MDD2854943.1 hypothetical protein [Desulfuromonadaceae bacterium]
MKKMVSVLLSIWIVLMFGGCATLEVTPPHQLKTAEKTVPATVLVEAAGERLRGAFSTSEESVLNAASGKLFEKVIMLPEEMQSKSPEELKAIYGSAYVLSVNIADVNVHGDLNPFWFIAAPMLFFKPLAPIVTFESTVTLYGEAVEAGAGALLLKREFSETSTDHFSPVKPEEKVRKLTTRSINGALALMLEELHSTVTKK